MYELHYEVWVGSLCFAAFRYKDQAERFYNEGTFRYGTTIQRRRNGRPCNDEWGMLDD